MSCVLTGWYCVGCEQYKDDGEMEGDHVCPLHKKPCVLRKEDNFFFRLSRYQQQIEASWVPLRPIISHLSAVQSGCG